MNLTLKIFVITFWASTFLVSAQRKEIVAAEIAIENGEFYLAKKNLEKVEQEISNSRRVLKSRFYMARGLTYLGLNSQNYNRLEDILKAQKDFEKVTELGGSTDGENGLKAIVSTLLLSVRQNQAEKDYRNAYKKLMILHQLKPRDTIYLFAAATNAFHAEDMDEEALRLFEQLKEIQYKGNEIQYLATNKLTGEEELFSDPELREEFIKAGYFDKPENRRAIPKKGEVIKGLALLYDRNDDREKAFNLLENAEKEHPENPEILKNIALAYYELGKKDEYQQRLRILLQKDPENKAVYYLLLGNLAQEEQEPRAARAYYKKMTELKPDYAEGYIALSNLILNEVAVNRDQMNKLTEEGQKDSEAYREAEHRQEQLYEEVIPFLEEAFKHDAANIDIIRALYQSHYLLGHTKAYKKYARLLENRAKELQKIQQQSPY